MDFKKAPGSAQDGVLQSLLACLLAAPARHQVAAFLQCSNVVISQEGQTISWIFSLAVCHQRLAVMK